MSYYLKIREIYNNKKSIKTCKISNIVQTGISVKLMLKVGEYNTFAYSNNILFGQNVDMNIKQKNI